MRTVLLTSGYPDDVVERVKQKWKVVNIPEQARALEYLKSGREKPVAVSIGLVGFSQIQTDLDAKRMLREIHKLDPTLPVIISTHEQSRVLMVDFIKQGAFDYVVEPMNGSDTEAWFTYTQDLVFALTRAAAWGEVTRENQRLKEDILRGHQPEFIKGQSAGILKVVDLVKKVAPTSATVLITGESGTGKELVARAIHGHSGNKEAPFTAVNCGAINESLLASELFGHVKGAFTGADIDRAGLISETGEGTLFLDEISTVSQSFQVMLLRVLEQRRARPVGGNNDYEVKCRFISAANCDLEAMVKENKFREDLFYRLNVFSIAIPPLRRRPEDIPILADFFLHEAARQFEKKLKGISPTAMEVLEEYSWPGNVRQLRNTIERAVIVSEGPLLEIGDLDYRIRNPKGPTEYISHSDSYEKAMERFEKDLLRKTLTRAKGKCTAAAHMLKMNRTTLIYRMKQLGIEG
jgi:two-component system, NtrC family, response regulator AtoC